MFSPQRRWNRLCSPVLPLTPTFLLYSWIWLESPRSTAFPLLSLDASHPSALRPLIGKANDSQVLRDRTQHSFTVSPRGSPEGLSQRCCISHLCNSLSWEGEGHALWAAHMPDLRGQCARGGWPSSQNKHSAQVTLGAAQRVSCPEVSSWNAGCLATGSCFSPNSNTWGLGLV